MPIWLEAFIGSAIGGGIAVFIAVEAERRKHAELWRGLQKLAHEVETLRKTQQIENEWFALSRELAEADGREAT